MTHYRVEVGPVRNSTAGLFTDECFRDEQTARTYGRVSLDKIELGRNRLGMFTCQQRETDTGRVLTFNGEDTWQYKVTECGMSGDCHVRVRLPITHKQ